MDDSKKIISRLERIHNSYVSSLNRDKEITLSNFKKLRKEIKALLRKKPCSENSVTQIIKLSSEFNRLSEFIKITRLPSYDFALEIEQINKYTIEYLKDRYTSKFGGKFKYKGENLLCLYLEVIIKFTILKSENQRNLRPDFLKTHQPKTT